MMLDVLSVSLVDCPLLPPPNPLLLLHNYLPSHLRRVSAPIFAAKAFGPIFNIQIYVLNWILYLGS